MTEQVVGKAVIRAEVDSSGVDAGVDRSKRSLASIGPAAAAGAREASAAIGTIGASADQTATKVDAASKKVADGFKRIPAAAGDAAGATEKLTVVQSRFLASLERQATITTQGRAAYLELKAAQLGVGEAAAASVAAIRAAEAAQVGLGNSARNTANQLRQVAPQVTDIVTQLAAGQAPLQILIQQGGQLKDVFGGVGPAARALGGYVLSLITPFTVTAVALGALTFAASQGGKELREFQNASTLTGNAVGLSAGQFTSLRDGIAGIAGSKGRAAEVLTEIAGNAKLAGLNVKSIAEAAVLMEKATGQSVKKTLDDFAKLTDEPTKGAIELNRQYNFLTASVFAQVKALEEQGKRAQAAEVAERALAETLKSRASSVVDNVGVMEKAWRGLTGVAKGAWDAMLNVGRDLSPAEKLSAAAADVARIQAQIAGVGSFGETGGGAATGGASAARTAALQGDLKLAKDRLASAQRINEITNQNAAAEGEKTRIQLAGVTAIDAVTAANDRYASKQQQLNKALSDYRRQLADIRAADPNSKLLDPKTVSRTESGIRQQFIDNAGESDVAAQRAAKRIAQEESARLRSSIESLDFTTPAKLTDGERKVITIQEELKDSLTATARANKERALSAAEAAVVDERSRASLEKQVEVVKKSRDEYLNLIVATGQQADAINVQAAGQERANALFGKSATAVEQVALATLRLQLAEADSSDRFDPRYVASLQAKVDAQKRYVDALQQSEFKQKSAQLTDAGRASAEEAATLQLELSLVGQTQLEREKIIGQRRVEVALAKELASIDKLNLGTGPDADAEREKLKAQARANSVVDANTAANKAVLNEWQRTADSINQSLTDALLRGFEAGKGFGENLRDTLSNMFKTLVLSPIIKGVLSPVSGAVSSVVNGIVGGGSGGLGSLGNIGSSLSSLFGGTAGADAIGAGLGSVAEQTAINGALGGAGGLSALSAAGPYALAAVAALSIGSSLFSSKGGPRASGSAGLGVEQYADNSLSAQLASVTNSYNAVLAQAIKALGGTSTASIGIGVSTDPRGTAPNFVQNAANVDGQVIRFRQDANVGRDDASLQAAIGAQAKEAVLFALKASDIRGELGDYLRSVDIQSNVEAIYDRVTKALNERSSLQDKLFDLTATDAQKLAKTRDEERAAVDATNLALLEQVYQQQDLAAAAEKAKAAVADLISSLDSALSSYRTSASGIGRGEARAQVETALVIAKAGGPLPDAAALKDAISVLSQVDQSNAKSVQDFVRQRDQEAQLLEQLKAAYEGTTTTPAISAAQAAANQAQTTAATVAAMEALQKKADEANAIAASAAADAQRSRDLLDAVVSGNASFATRAEL